MKSVKGILATTLFSASLMLSSVGANADDSAIIKLDKPITYEVGIHKKVKVVEKYELDREKIKSLTKYDLDLVGELKPTSSDPHAEKQMNYVDQNLLDGYWMNLYGYHIKIDRSNVMPLLEFDNDLVRSADVSSKYSIKFYSFYGEEINDFNYYIRPTATYNKNVIHFKGYDNDKLFERWHGVYIYPIDKDTILVSESESSMGDGLVLFHRVKELPVFISDEEVEAEIKKTKERQGYDINRSEALSTLSKKVRISNRSKRVD